MNEDEKLTIRGYCNSKGITIADLAKMTGVSYPQLFLIRHNREANLTTNTIRKIELGTEKAFGEPLTIWQYLQR